MSEPIITKTSELYHMLLKVNSDLLCSIIHSGGNLSEDQMRQRLGDACNVLHEKTMEQSLSAINAWSEQ